jgi:hypothetical protein
MVGVSEKERGSMRNRVRVMTLDRATLGAIAADVVLIALVLAWLLVIQGPGAVGR